MIKLNRFINILTAGFSFLLIYGSISYASPVATGFDTNQYIQNNLSDNTSGDSICSTEIGGSSFIYEGDEFNSRVYAYRDGDSAQTAYIITSPFANKNKDEYFGDKLVVVEHNGSKYMFINAYNADVNNVPNAGAIALYKLNATSATYICNLTSSNTNTGNKFGLDMALVKGNNNFLSVIEEGSRTIYLYNIADVIANNCNLQPRSSLSNISGINEHSTVYGGRIGANQTDSLFLGNPMANSRDGQVVVILDPENNFPANLNSSGVIVLDGDNREQLGSSLYSGDVDGDNSYELFVGAPEYEMQSANGFIETGAVLVYTLAGNQLMPFKDPSNQEDVVLLPIYKPAVNNPQLQTTSDNFAGEKESIAGYSVIGDLKITKPNGSILTYNGAYQFYLLVGDTGAHSGQTANGSVVAYAFIKDAGVYGQLSMYLSGNGALASFGKSILAGSGQIYPQAISADPNKIYFAISANSSGSSSLDIGGSKGYETDPNIDLSLGITSVPGSGCNPGSGIITPIITIDQPTTRGGIKFTVSSLNPNIITTNANGEPIVRVKCGILRKSPVQDGVCLRYVDPIPQGEVEVTVDANPSSVTYGTATGVIIPNAGGVVGQEVYCFAEFDSTNPSLNGVRSSTVGGYIMPW